MYSARLHLPRRAVGSPSPASPLSSAALRSRRLKVSPRPSRSRFTIAISELLELCPRASGFGIQSVARVRRKSSSISLAAPISAMDEDSFGGFSLFDDEGYEMPGGHIWSSGEESDTDLVVNSSGDVDLPRRRETESPDSMLTVTAHRFATIQRGYRNNRISGVMINMGLIAFFSLFLIFVDWCSWRIVRLPLEPFYLTRPFSISAVLSACVGCLYVPLVDSMKIHQIVKKKGPIIRSKRAIPTTGGLFFIPIGITIARGLSGEHSIPVYGAALATMIFAAIGFLDDILNRSKDESNGVPRWIKFLLLVAVSTWFSFWLNSSNISTPYSMKFLVPLPQPIGLVYLGNLYLILTPFCFIAMVNGVKLTNGLDGLAGGAAALSFIGMAVAVLAVCPDLAVFGASMAGACIGFLFHNKYKASVCMGETGTLALGGALAAMAACTGMFLPLFISSGVFVLEILSIVVQVLYLLATRREYLDTRRLLRVTPLHRLLLSYGLHEPVIVSITYVVSGILALVAGYVGLISA